MPVTVAGRVLDNGLIRVELAEDGTLSSVRDHRAGGREVLADKGNLLRLHTDLPNYWDAWDIDKHYRNRYTDLLDADEAFLTSTLKEAAPIRIVGDRPIGSGRPGPITLRILAAFREYAQRDRS